MLQAAPAGAPGAADGPLSLRRALDLIPLRNPDVGMADIAVRQAEADETTAGERPNGQLSLSTSDINTAGHNGPGSYWDKYYDTIVSFSQTFERGHKRRFRLDQARASLDAAHSDYANVLRLARLAVSDAYWELKRSEEKLANAQALADIEHRSLHAAEQRLHAGDAPALDVQRIRIETAQADSALDAARSARDDARVTLAGLLAWRGGYEQLATTDDWPAGTPDAAGPGGKPDERADVLAAEQRVHAAEAALEGAHALRHRDITFSVQYEHAPAPGPPPTPGNGNTLLGVGVSIPIFTGNGYHGEIARAHADLDAAQATRDRAALEAQNDLARARADLAAAAARAARYDGGLLEQARQAAATAETAYARGGLGLTDLLDARRAFKAVQDDATDAHADYAEAQDALRAAVPNLAEASTP
ncbi:TolC family protein [Frateuria defendens]|uniref:TolC family protein n=1 Tax=Frateuria defendens TaxID=2219559 RepID=UPI00066FC6C7|nr:TolC family protein [Frateuria defendens]